MTVRCGRQKISSPSGKDRTEISARVLVNTAGPWIDDVFGLLAAPVGQKVEKRKGTHIRVRLPDCLRGEGFYLVTPGGKSRFVPPRGEEHVFGVTNTSFADDPSTAAPTNSEIKELVADMKTCLSVGPFNTKDVLGTWSGVRPATSGSSGRRGVRVHSGLPKVWSLHEEGLPNAFAVTGASIGSQYAVARDLRKKVADALSD